MKKTILIPYFSKEISMVDFVSVRMDNTKKYPINNNPWNYDFSGDVNFSIAYNDEAVLVKFFVVEEEIRAIYTQPNDPVYKDSCVEFFIGFNNEESYYNFEFNCKGTCLAGFGNGKDHRKPMNIEKIKSIKTSVTFKTISIQEKLMINWELTLVIPNSVFQFHQINSLKNQIVSVNFYKCGDDLSKPHFLCWSPIESEHPNFHLSQYFGKAIFLDN